MGWTEGELIVDEMPIHYYRMGQRGKPPVVLLHGFSDAGLCWLRLARDLEADYDLVMVDAIGHGKSGGPERGFRERAASDVLAVIAALELDRPALIGHSMGAGTASRVAAMAGEQLRGIVLEDPGWRDTPATVGTPGGLKSRAPLRSPEWVAWIGSLPTMSQEERQAEAARERPEWAPSDREPWIEAKSQFNVAIAALPMDTSSPPWRETVKQISCPILLITADTELGAIVTPEAAREAATLWRRGRVVHIPGAGHNIRRAQYAPFRAATAEFLREVLG